MSDLTTYQRTLKIFERTNHLIMLVNDQKMLLSYPECHMTIIWLYSLRKIPQFPH